jgi:hypothetical protein
VAAKVTCWPDLKRSSRADPDLPPGAVEVVVEAAVVEVVVEAAVVEVVVEAAVVEVVEGAVVEVVVVVVVVVPELDLLQPAATIAIVATSTMPTVLRDLTLL